MSIPSVRQASNHHNEKEDGDDIDNDDDDEVRKQIYLYICHWSRIPNFISIRREFSFYSVK